SLLNRNLTGPNHRRRRSVRPGADCAHPQGVLMQLYDYQERVIAEVEQHKNPLIVSPTGSGKTVMASAIIERNPNKFVLFFAHRTELVFQPRDTLAKCRVNAGVILAGTEWGVSKSPLFRPYTPAAPG